MQIGLTEEGGCPFSQFDDESLNEFLTKNMPPGDNVFSKIMQLRQEGYCSEACTLYMRANLRLYRNDECPINFESPVGYYFALKSCADDSLSW